MREIVERALFFPRVNAGEEIATVTPWTDGTPHTHIELWKTLEGGYNPPRVGAGVVDVIRALAGLPPKS